MIGIFSKRFWELRKKRKRIIAEIKTCRGHAFYVNKTERYGGCYHCGERTYSISTLITKTSLAGEKFYYQSYPIAYVCPRCECVSAYEDTSGGEIDMLVWDWLKAPCKMPKAVIQTPGRTKPPIPPEPV